MTKEKVKDIIRSAVNENADISCLYNIHGDIDTMLLIHDYIVPMIEYIKSRR